MKPMPECVRAALARLMEIAGRDTGQSRRAANFLLAWWNATECGGFDLSDAWGLDREIAADMATVFAYVVLALELSRYPGLRARVCGFGAGMAASVVR